ncbi:MAG: iron ABC transporter permease [Spirochaetaceae bacterium]|jgi:iron complex transport system permease protein|nr:iron ABC transporter permease [Spirochaetaceae bacterium]
MNKPARITFCCIISFIIFVAAVSIGSHVIHPQETLIIFIHKLCPALFPGQYASINDSNTDIIWQLRLPRVLLAFLSGGCLAVSGAAIQSILKNQLASPYILGVSSGASLGAAFVMLSGAAIPFFPAFTLPLTGFLFALLTTMIVATGSSRLDKTMSNNTIVLFGMVTSLFINAVLALLVALYRKELDALIMWQMGSFAFRGWPYLKILVPFFLVGMIGILRWTREMDIMTFGDEHALSAGVEVKSAKRGIFLFSTLLTGSAVAVSGVIGFVDLIAPHVSRKITGAEHRFVIPVSFITGGTLCVAADLLARTLISPSELPVGALTALIGAPLFIWIYFKKK